jgi:predicted transcriptional regulator of viral defense system
MEKYRRFVTVGGAMIVTRTEEVLALARQHGIVTARALRERGIAPTYLQRLTARGLLTRVARGIYEPTDGADITALHTLVEACLRVPSGVVCLLSALRFHHLTTQAPHEVWLAIDSKARAPRVTYPPLRIVRFGGDARTTGVETHRVEGQEIRVYGVAKTVADCFKYRNKIGLDVAIAALADAWRGGRTTMDDLWRAAQVDRVTAVMQPYLTAVQG